MRATSIDDHEPDGRKRPPHRVDLALDPAGEPGNRESPDSDAEQREDARLGERGEMLGLPVAVLVAPVGGASRDAEGEEREQGGDEVGPRVDGLGDEPQRAGAEPRHELQRDQGDGGADRDEGGAPLRRHARIVGTGRARALPGVQPGRRGREAAA